MRLLPFLTFSISLLASAVCAPSRLEGQAELYARPAPDGRSASMREFSPDVTLHVAKLVEARERYGAHANTLFEVRISPGSEPSDSRVAAELCLALEADATAVERHAVWLAKSGPRGLDRWLTPLAELARTSRGGAAGLRSVVEAEVPLEEKRVAVAGARELLKASGEMGLLLAGLKQDLGVTTSGS